MKKLNLIFTLFALSSSLFAQKKPCSPPEYRQFDFWIGTWEAYGPKGKKAGDSKISLLLDSCTIFEEWTSTSTTSGITYSGKSFNMYNADEKKWQQYWVDNTGKTTTYSNGHYENNKMILETNNEKVNDTLWQIQRMTFYNVDPNTVRQHGETSNDNGKTWTTSFDLMYRRKK